MALDDAAVHAVQDPVHEDDLPVRPRLTTQAEIDLRLIRIQVIQQSQLLASLHQVMVAGLQVVEERLTRFGDELATQTEKIDRITEMLESINKQLEVR